MNKLITDIIKNIASRFVDMSVNGRIDDYRSNFFQYQNMMAQVTMESDKAMLTFSLAALAALAALNDSVFEPYGWISFITLACFMAVAALVITGYSISKALIKSARDIMSQNFKESLTTPLDKGFDRIKYRKLSVFINRVSYILFVAGMISFVALMGLHIKGV